MSEKLVYLIKSSRLSEYHSQNVEILSANENEVFEISYTNRWIADDVTLEPGMGCVIVFADSPYTEFVPVRFATIESVVEHEGRWNLSVKVRSFIGGDSSERLTKLWNEIPAETVNRPGSKFVLVSDDLHFVHTASLKDEINAWRTVVEKLSTNGYFKNSVIARLLSIETRDGKPIDGNIRIRVGDEAVARLLTLVPDRSSSVRTYVECEPGNIIRSEEVAANDEGIVEVPLVARENGSADITIRFFPNPSRSSKISTHLSVAKTTAGETPDEESKSLNGDNVDLFKLMEKILRISADRQSASFEIAASFFEFAPNNYRVRGKFADIAFERKSYEDVIEALEPLSERLPQQDYQLVIASLVLKRKFDINLLGSMDLERDENFQNLISHLKESNPALIAQSLKYLTELVLSDDRHIYAFTQLFGKLTDTRQAMEFAQNAVFADPGAVISTIVQRWPDPRTAPARELIANELAGWKSRCSGQDPWIQFYLRTRIEENAFQVLIAESDDLMDLVDESTRIQLEWEVAHCLMKCPDSSVRHEGFNKGSLNITKLETERDLLLAVERLEVMEALAKGHFDTEYAESFKERIQNIKKQIEESEDYAEFIAFRNQTAYTKLSSKLSGIRIHVVGGIQQQWKDEVESGLNLKELRWHESEAKGMIDHDWVDDVSEPDIIVVITARIGHALSEPIRAKCRTRKITHIDCNGFSQGKFLRSLSEYYGV